MDWITLVPKPGLVVKSTTLASGYYHYDPSEFVQPASDPAHKPKDATKINVPANHKVFINLAYASAVPPPPIDDESVVQRALLGQVQDEFEYFIPVLVGFGREDVDKAGKPSTVFDAFLNPVVKKRLTEDLNYRSYVLEIILSTLESPPTAPSERSLSLSRTLATPNVRFKGPLIPRRVRKSDLEVFSKASTDLKLNSNPSTSTNSPTHPKKPLIEELPSTPNTPPAPTSSKKQPTKSILKRTSLPTSDIDTNQHVKSPSDANLTTPTWRWSHEKPDEDLLIRININVPDMTRLSHSQSALSLSTDIMTIRTPQYFLQIPLNNQSVKIPPNRVVDIDKASAEWRIGDKTLVVYLRCVLVS